VVNLDKRPVECQNVRFIYIDLNEARDGAADFENVDAVAHLAEIRTSTRRIRPSTFFITTRMSGGRAARPAADLKIRA